MIFIKFLKFIAYPTTSFVYSMAFLRTVEYFGRSEVPGDVYCTIGGLAIALTSFFVWPQFAWPQEEQND